MTRKDYELIAAVLADYAPKGLGFINSEREAQIGQWLDMVDDMADALAKDNPRFDKDRFLRACGVA